MKVCRGAERAGERWERCGGGRGGVVCAAPRIENRERRWWWVTRTLVSSPPLPFLLSFSSSPSLCLSSFCPCLPVSVSLSPASCPHTYHRLSSSPFLPRLSVSHTRSSSPPPSSSFIILVPPPSSPSSLPLPFPHPPLPPLPSSREVPVACALLHR